MSILHRGISAAFKTVYPHSNRTLSTLSSKSSTLFTSNINHMQLNALHKSFPVGCPNFHTTTVTNVQGDKSTNKSLTLWGNVRELKASPVPALVLGLSGLIPFVAAPSYMVIQGMFHADIAFAQLAYGASILSFLGGVRWGLTLSEGNPVAVQPDWINLGYSVLPSLVAWVGLLLPHPFNFFTLMGGLTLTAYCDMAMFGYPAWFKGMRCVLSFVAILSLGTTFVCSLIFTQKKDNKK